MPSLVGLSYKPTGPWDHIGSIFDMRNVLILHYRGHFMFRYDTFFVAGFLYVRLSMVCM